jgi:hypothetical protein
MLREIIALPLFTINSFKASNASDEETASYTTCFCIWVYGTNSDINFSVDGLPLTYSS